MSCKASFEKYLELLVIQRDMNEVLNDDCYSTIWFNGGDDGPLATEIYRMLLILHDDEAQLTQLIEEIKTNLPSSNLFFQ